jgi:hypothetical protein
MKQSKESHIEREGWRTILLLSYLLFTCNELEQENARLQWDVHGRLHVAEMRERGVRSRGE